VKDGAERSNDMGTPSVVQRQAEISERIRKEAYEVKPTDKVDTDIIETLSPEEEEAEKQRLDDEAEKERLAKEVDWKGKHDALYGQYSEIVSINKALAEESANLRADISVLRTELNALKTKEPPPPEPDEAEFTSLQEQFPEVTKLSAIQLRREISKRDTKISLLEERLGKLEAGVSTVTRRVEKTEGQGFEKEMDTLVDKRGNWKQMNTPGSEFLKWVGTERIHGHLRYDLMTSSYQRGDFPAVAEHFNDFIAMKNPPKKKNEEEIVEGEENLGLPKPGSSFKPPKDDKALEDKRTITRTFVKNTLKDIALRKYRSNPKEAERLKKLIDDKTAKGLIVDG
jgi:hypothetical protein